MVTVHYKCLQCEAVDSFRFEPDETPFPAINCWKCHAGMEFKNINQQVARQVGMFPTGEVVPD